MSYEYVRNTVIPAAFALLPAELDSKAARTQTLTHALQESRCEHRRQLGGPARGFWQFEKGGGVRGVRGYIFQHPQAKVQAEKVLRVLSYETATEDERFVAIEHNDILACLFARVLIYTHPKPLPQRGQREYAWGYYLDTWRPGQPRRDTFDAFFDRAWADV